MFIIRYWLSIIIKPNKSSDLQLASWRLRRIYGVISVQKPKGSRPRRADILVSI